jgi:hypothetical protein
MKKKYSKIILIASIIAFIPISSTIANGKWVKIGSDTILNLNQYSTIKVKGYRPKPYGCGIQFDGITSFLLMIPEGCSDNLGDMSNPKTSKSTNKIIEELSDFLDDDDDEYMELD